MRMKNIALIFIIIWIALTILAVTWRVTFDWPDNVHVDYGFPLVWVTHTLSTIVGPVDIWSFDLSALILNLLLWLGLMAVTLLAMSHISRRTSSNSFPQNNGSGDLGDGS